MKKSDNEIHEDYASFPEIYGEEIDLITPELMPLPPKKRNSYKTHTNGSEPYKCFPENEEELIPLTPYKKAS